IPLSSIKRIEIIDGANTALYGNNAVGGTINIITKENAEQNISIEAEYGMHNDASAQLVFNFADEEWGVGTFLSYFGSTGWKDRTGFQSASGLITSFFDFNDFFYIKSNLKYSFAYLEYPGSVSKEQFEENPFTTNNHNDDSLEHDFSFYINPSLTFDEEISVQMPLSYQYRNISYNTESSYPQPLFSTRNVHTFDFRPFFLFSSKNSKRTTALKMNILAGVDFSWVALTNNDFFEKERKDEVNKAAGSQIQVAPYISTKLFLPYNFSIQAVIRYDLNFLNIFQSSERNPKESLSFQAFVYSLNVLYNPLKQLSFYISASSLFRYPFIDEIAAFSYGWSMPINYDLKPEAGYNIDFGFKVDVNQYFKMNANVFFMPMVDEISYNATTFRNENLDASMRIGTNIDISSQITSFFEISASFTYLNAQFAVGDNKGKSIPLVSPYTAGLTFSFLLPQNISLSTDVSYRSSFYRGGDFSNSQTMMDGYFLWNLGVFYSPPQLDKKLSFSFVMKNLLNKMYVPYAYYTSYYPAQGFSLSAGVKYTF
ncbi:MAG: TonB-dependent receptor, partial [Treponemataceae bacterium]